MTIILFIFTFSNCHFFIFFNFHIVSLVHAMYICFVCNDELYIYICVCLSWNEYHVLFCSVNVLKEKTVWKGDFVNVLNPWVWWFYGKCVLWTTFLIEFLQFVSGLIEKIDFVKNSFKWWFCKDYVKSVILMKLRKLFCKFRCTFELNSLIVEKMLL